MQQQDPNAKGHTVSPIQVTLVEFPETGSVKDNAGLPWGCSVQPFIDLSLGNDKKIEPPTTIERCENCFAYINRYVSFSRNKWRCSICQSNNYISGNNSRYASLTSRAKLPELTEQCIDVLLETVPDSNIKEFPLFVALVDATGDKDYVELIKSGLLAAIEALNPLSFFGLMLFADKIGVYDLRSSFPHLLNIHVPSSPTAGPSVTLAELFMNEFPFVQVGSFKSNIISAIESLKPVDDPSQKRSLGSAITSLIDYISDHVCFKNVRVLTFVRGLSNYGQGMLSIPEKDLLAPQTTFYKEKASKAARSGLCIDLFILPGDPPQFIGLPSIKFLSLITGGNIMFYGGGEDSMLPQDIYRQLARPLAFQGLLRLRTSTNFHPSNSFGHLLPDINYENLYHVAGCDQFKTFTFDFEFSSGSGFSNGEEGLPTLQLAFSFSCLPEGSTNVVRVLRVCTVQLGVATSPQEIYHTADVDAILSLLTHKIIRSSLDEGIKEARELLQDWMTILLTNYNEHVATLTGPKRGTKILDTTFSKYPNLKHLSRLVFGLLKNPLLSADTTDADYWSYLHALYSALSPKFLHRAIYPVMSSYGAVNNLSSQHLPLSRSAVLTSSCKLFLIDAFSVIVVFQLAEGNEKVDKDAFPPPKDSLLRNTVNHLKQDRLIMPRVIFAKTGTPDEQYFDMLLIEEQNKFGTSYSHFLEWLQVEINKV